MSSWHVNATIRIKSARFHFADNTWEVEAYMNFNAPNSNDSIVSNTVVHKWFAYGEDFKALEKILEKKIGSDMLGPQKTIDALSKDYNDD